MTARTLAVAALVVAALAPAAAAKEITDARLCGTEGCTALAGITDHTMFDGAMVDPPGQPAPFVELIYEFRAGEQREQLINQFVMSAGLVRLDTGYWMRVTPAERERLGRVAAGLDPFPAAKLLEIAPEMPRSAGPAAAAPEPRGDSGGGPPPAGIAAAALLALALVLAARSTRRRRTVPQP